MSTSEVSYAMANRLWVSRCLRRKYPVARWSSAGTTNWDSFPSCKPVPGAARSLTSPARATEKTHKACATEIHHSKAFSCAASSAYTQGGMACLLWRKSTFTVMSRCGSSSAAVLSLAARMPCEARLRPGQHAQARISKCRFSSTGSWQVLTMSGN